MLDDLKFAWRRLRHAPGFAVVATLTLAIAVGANTAILSIADGVLFRPLPYQHPDRVFLIQMGDRRTGGRGTRVDYDVIRMIDERHGGLGEVGRVEAFGSNVTLDGPDGPTPAPSTTVSANYFRILGVRPALGRLFREDDADAPGRAAMLSHASWQQRFGGDPEIAGRTLTVGGLTVEVVGVLPADFMYPASASFVGKPEIVTVMAPIRVDEAGGTFHPIVRLGPGVTRKAAQAELDVLAARLSSDDPNVGEAVPFLEDIRDTIYPTGRPLMQFMVAAAMLVLMLGCANLANVLLARGRRRERETAVRAALGAGRLRVVRPVVFEALIVGAVGSALALAVASLTFKALLSQVPTVVYGNAPIGVDQRVALFGVALGMIGALVFALAPAWQTARLDTQAVIQRRRRGGVMRGGRGGRPMVAVQVGLAILLVFGAAVATRAFVSVLRVPLGFNPDNVVMFIPARLPEGESAVIFYRRLLETVASRGDVVATGGIGSPPLGAEAPWSGALRPGTSNEPVADVMQTLPGYFETIEIPLVRGRFLAWEDTADRSAAVVSEAAARALFGEAEPLGQVFSDTAGDVFRVVGVARDARLSLSEDRPATAYVLPNDRGRVYLMARMRERRAVIAADLARELGIDASAIRWWTDRISNLTEIRNPRFQTLILSSFAVIALGLTALGVFGVVACLVASQAREMGIRAAIGATPRSLVSLMVQQALMPVAVGVALGLLATRWLASFAEAQLYEVNTHDPATLVAVTITVVLTALLAASIPARRAGRVDPVIAMRAE